MKVVNVASACLAAALSIAGAALGADFGGQVVASMAVFVASAACLSLSG